MERPNWLDQEPKQWPASARIAYGILLRAALRRMEQQALRPRIGPGRTPSLNRLSAKRI